MLYQTYKDLKRGLGIHFYNDPPGGAGGGGGGNTTPPAKADPAAALAKENADLKAELEKLRAAPPAKPDPKDDPSLIDKARASREAADKDSNRTKQLESSIRFNMAAPEFLKKNASLLPKDVSDIFTQAEKENFSDAIEKDGAIKSGLIQSFFAVQANVDLLTAGQKATLDDFLKLTKNGKQEKAQALYDMVFEPAFEMLKRTKRAEALSKGHMPGDDADDAYKNKLIARSRKHYLGEKEK